MCLQGIECGESARDNRPNAKSRGRRYHILLECLRAGIGNTVDGANETTLGDRIVSGVMNRVLRPHAATFETDLLSTATRIRSAVCWIRDADSLIAAMALSPPPIHVVR
jgi:hypothetical protein